MGGFVTDVEDLRGGGLHAEAEFHGLDDAIEALVLRARGKVTLVHRLDEIELTALGLQRKMIARDVGNRGVRHVLTVDADRSAGADGGKEGAGVERGLGGVQADVAGEILVLGAKAVIDP